MADLSTTLTGDYTSTCGEPCKCCNGSGIQINIYSGLRVICPCCGGKGTRYRDDYYIISKSE